MNQNEFFNILMDGLKDFPEIKLQDIISYYENNFRLGLASGKTEQEILSELGDPNLIVNKYRNEDLETPTRDAYITPDNNNNNNNNNYSNYNSKFNNNRSSDSNSSNFNDQIPKNKTSQFNVNTLLKISIVILSLIIFFPVITGIIGCIFGLLGVAIGILFGSIGLLIGGTFTSFVGGPNVPMFVANFPYPVIVLFSLGSISLSIILSLIFYYLCKFFIRISVKSFKSLKSKGGAF